MSREEQTWAAILTRFPVQAVIIITLQSDPMIKQNQKLMPYESHMTKLSFLISNMKRRVASGLGI